MLTLTDVTVAYGPVQALTGISLHLDEGEVVALLGANGAGKTTLLRAISGLVPLQSGQIRFQGQSLANRPAFRIVAAGIAHCPEGRRIFPDLTVLENLDMGAYTVRDHTLTRPRLERVFRYFPILSERGAQKAGTLSGGEQQMLAVARALMSAPRLILLDEPSLGLAPKLIDQIFDIVRQINREENTTVFLVEQNANEALLHADRGYVLDNGALTLTGPADELRRNPRVIEAYLGK